MGTLGDDGAMSGGPANSTHLVATYAYQIGVASGLLGEGAAEFQLGVGVTRDLEKVEGAVDGVVGGQDAIGLHLQRLKS